MVAVEQLVGLEQNPKSGAAKRTKRPLYLSLDISHPIGDIEPLSNDFLLDFSFTAIDGRLEHTSV